MVPGARKLLAGLLLGMVLPAALLALPGCGRERAVFRLTPKDAVFFAGGVRVALPAGHPLQALQLREVAGHLLVAQPVPAGQPVSLPLEVPWAPGEKMVLVGVTSSGGTISLPLAAPPVAGPPVLVALELPGGVPVPGGTAPLLLPAGSEVSLALSLRSLAARPLRLTVTLVRPPLLQPVPVPPGPQAPRAEPQAPRAEPEARRAEPDAREMPAAGGESPQAPQATPGGAWQTPAGQRQGAGPRTVRLDLPQQTERLSYRFRVGAGEGAVAWRVTGLGLGRVLEGRRALRAVPAAELRAELRARDQGFPADGEGRLMPHRPRNSLIFHPPWAETLLAVLGQGAPRDPYRPVGYARVSLHNPLAGEVVALLRTWVAHRPDGPPLPAFGNPLRGVAGLGSHALVRVPAGGSLAVAQPVFFDPSRGSPGAFWRCSEVRPWGLPGSGPATCVAFRVTQSPLWGWVAIWGGTALGVGIFLLALARLGRWVGRFPLRDLALIALMAGLAFLLVSIPGLVLRTVTLFLLGPFNFLVEGLVFKGLLFFLLGSLFALVRRPGVFFLFYCLWMVAQAVLNGHTSPTLVLFAGVTITLIETGLWVGGITRPGAAGKGPPLLWAALAVGLAEGLSVFWGMQLLKVLYRQFFADWFVLLQSTTEGLYAAVGVAAGLALGRQLSAMRRPPLGVRGGLGAADVVGAAGPSSPPPAGKPAPGVPLLQVRGLGFTYAGAGQPMLRGLDFALAAGEVLLVAGNSGSGKTTLFRLLKGLLPWPAEAGFFLGGSPAAGWAPETMAQQVGLLFQEPALQVVRATVAGEVALGLELLGVPPAETSRRVAAALARLGLEGLADRRLETLSGGELQKTALAAVLAPCPPVLLLDEPLAHLDVAGRQELLARVRALAESGCGILIAEHRAGPVLEAADRVILLHPGAPPWVGTPAAFRRSSWFQAAEAALPAPRQVGAGAGRLPSPAPEAGFAGRGGAEGGAAARLRAVTFRHGSATPPLLEAAHATLHPGSAVALTGANGTGKTTLLTLLLGLRRPQQGAVGLGAVAAHRLGWPAKARLAGYLPQQAHLVLQASTVARELAMSLRWRGMAPAQIAEKVAVWLDRIGLTEAAHRFPHLLSRGERQRLALAAVMIAAPPLLVLDEPFAGQDAHQIARLLALCREYLEEAKGRTLIAATHDLEPVAGFFDFGWRLEQGLLTVERLPGVETAAQTAIQGSPLVMAAGGGP